MCAHVSLDAPSQVKTSTEEQCDNCGGCDPCDTRSPQNTEEEEAGSQAMTSLPVGRHYVGCQGCILGCTVPSSASSSCSVATWCHRDWLLHSHHITLPWMSSPACTPGASPLVRGAPRSTVEYLVLIFLLYTPTFVPCL